MNVNVKVINLDMVLARLGQIPDATRRAVKIAIQSLTQRLFDQVQANISGEVLLGTANGPLFKSIQSDLQDDGETIDGIVYSDGSVPYAAILEYGGTTRPHEIRPVNAQALAFMAGGKGQIGKSSASGLVFAMVVHHPGSRIPEFAYARRALAGMRRDIVAEITAAALTRAMEVA